MGNNLNNTSQEGVTAARWVAPVSTSNALGSAAPPAATARTERPNEGGTWGVNQPPTSAECVGGEAAYRLEKRTHLDEATYRVVLRDYGNGLAEIGWSFVPALAPHK